MIILWEGIVVEVVIDIVGFGDAIIEFMSTVGLPTKQLQMNYGKYFSSWDAMHDAYSSEEQCSSGSRTHHVVVGVENKVDMEEGA